MRHLIITFKNKIIIFLSHHPKLYALTAGVGIVLFWRGVWHSTDVIHTYFNYYYYISSIDSSISPWWDGPLSLIVGILLLYFSGAFVSSFIGNELILSGLRGERKLNQRTEGEVKKERHSISDIKNALEDVRQKLEEMEKDIEKK